MTATLSAAAIAKAVTLVPTASPTASPAAASGQPSTVARPLTPFADAALRRIAIAARISAAATRSFFAAPGSRTTRVWHSRTTAVEATQSGPRP